MFSIFLVISGIGQCTIRMAVFHISLSVKIPSVVINTYSLAETITICSLSHPLFHFLGTARHGEIIKQTGFNIET